jgi:hypothetical protein
MSSSDVSLCSEDSSSNQELYSMESSSNQEQPKVLTVGSAKVEQLFLEPKNGGTEKPCDRSNVEDVKGVFSRITTTLHSNNCPVKVSAIDTQQLRKCNFSLEISGVEKAEIHVVKDLVELHVASFSTELMRETSKVTELEKCSTML